jgi:hypothetical protein
MHQGHDNAVLKSIQGVKAGCFRWITARAGSASRVIDNIKGLPHPRQALERGFACKY